MEGQSFVKMSNTEAYKKAKEYVEWFDRRVEEERKYLIQQVIERSVGCTKRFLFWKKELPPFDEWDAKHFLMTHERNLYIPCTYGSRSAWDSVFPAKKEWREKAEQLMVAAHDAGADVYVDVALASVLKEKDSEQTTS